MPCKTWPPFLFPAIFKYFSIYSMENSPPPKKNPNKPKQKNPTPYVNPVDHDLNKPKATLPENVSTNVTAFSWSTDF